MGRLRARFLQRESPLIPTADAPFVSLELSTDTRSASTPGRTTIYAETPSCLSF
jgi:hypothetical protein